MASGCKCGDNCSCGDSCNCLSGTVKETTSLINMYVNRTMGATAATAAARVTGVAAADERARWRGDG
ncbi:hypothetical protein SDJN02_18152 [Cucurbita argyrosperma subsp. argyrosperma]|nr:hypothetical protein SDJN02_18152 [Cucurbita argyrosperma subsp. argyrosperma]